MAQQNDRKFVNGFFAKQVWADGDRQLLGVGIKKDEFIKNLQAIRADENGFINLTMGSQKADPLKFSLFESDYKKGNSSSSSSSSSNNKPSSSPSTPPPDDTDDLPF